MAFVPQIKCRRCGSEFSGLRHRCPNCGTRRVGSSSRSPGTSAATSKGSPASVRAQENRKWQLVFGGILVGAIIIALIVMISVSLKNSDVPDFTPSTPPPDISAAPSPEPSPTPTPTPAPEISDLMICYFGDEMKDFTCRIGENVPLTGSHFPLTIPADYKWSSNDPGIAKVSESGTVTGVSPGMTTVTLTCYGKTATCTVYVNG